MSSISTKLVDKWLCLWDCTEKCQVASQPSLKFCSYKVRFSLGGRRSGRLSSFQSVILGEKHQDQSQFSDLVKNTDDENSPKLNWF